MPIDPVPYRHERRNNRGLMVIGQALHFDGKFVCNLEGPTCQLEPTDVYNLKLLLTDIEGLTHPAEYIRARERQRQDNDSDDDFY